MTSRIATFNLTIITQINEKMKKTLSGIFLLTALSMGVLLSCGGDDDDDNGRNDDNGTDIENTGGNGKTTLSPDNEKAFLEETSRLFLSYFDASEFDEISNAFRQVGDTDDEAFDDWLDDIMEKTLTDFYSGWYHSYEEYDALIRMANVKGSFTGSYDSGAWIRTSDSGNFTLNYTDRNNALWVLTVVPSGNVMGEVYVGEYDQYDSYRDKYYDLTVEVPQKITAQLTRQGETKATVSLNVNSLDVSDGEVSAMSKANASATVTLLSFTSTTTFSYTPNDGSSVSATVKKGSTTLLQLSMSGTPRVTNRDEELTAGRNVTATVDILGRVQVHATCTDTQTLSDALDKADENDDDGDIVSQCVTRANNAFTAYITNNGGSAQQAELKFARTSEKDYGYTYYYMTPTLQFSDDTSYSFEEYFSKRYFQNVIDTFNQIVDDFADLAE